MSGPAAGSRWSDEQVEHFVGNLLRYGVMTAAIVAFAGGIFRGEPPNLTSVTGVVGGALALNPRSVIQLGLLLLIATPVARVAFSLLAFIRQRDRTYIVITTIVLALLLYSLMGFDR